MILELSRNLEVLKNFTKNGVKSKYHMPKYQKKFARRQNTTGVGRRIPEGRNPGRVKVTHF